MPTSRRFTWTYKPPLPEEAAWLCAQARGVLAVFCEDWPQWYSNLNVSGAPMGLVLAEVTITSRDQWWVQKRARKLLSAFLRHTDLPAVQMTEISEKLPPHEHRGKAYLKGKSSGSSD